MPDPQTLFGIPAGDHTRLDGARIAILGAAEASPYDAARPSHSADAPAAIRRASQACAHQHGHHDFDLDAPFLPPALLARIRDCGDLPTDRADAPGNRAAITAATRSILDQNAVPILIGGDDSVPIPWFDAFEGRGPFTVVQVDAHADWGDVIRGNPHGYGSTMRRASERPWITGMVQVGLRGLGSGTPDQLVDARAWGSHLVTDRDLRREGMHAALRHIAPGAECLVAIDCDGIDPAVLPAVAMPTPGGPGYADLLDLLRGVAERGRIAGLALVELVPARDDPNGLSALTAARILASAIGLIGAASG